MSKKIIISGVGCCLVDYLYNNISFALEPFSKYLSKEPGDGGVTPGQLVFSKEFENFTRMSLAAIISEISQGKAYDKINVGGPGIVAIIHVAQMLEGTGCSVRFYGGRGEDEAGEYLQSFLKKTPVVTDNYNKVYGSTPTTVVLSDPSYNNGTGERAFINSIGAAGNYLPEFLDSTFYESNVVVFGGTALVPAIHDNLTELLAKAKAEGCITVVNTVYDFRNQKAWPYNKWPLGKSDDSYQHTDLLITNLEEALRLSGKNNISEAMDFFRKLGTGAVVVTNGANEVTLFANRDSIFKEIGMKTMPISAAISEDLKNGKCGDTTGCGDNFAGGVIANVIEQLQNGKMKLDVEKSVIWGIVSGGFSCFYMGGTYHQKQIGKKRKLINSYYMAYLKQVKNG